MAEERLHSLMRGLRQLHDAAGGSVADAQLLERFVAQRDEAAFELIVWRHGPAVLGLCRRLLRHEADVEDAFQATFLTLVRKARAIVRGEALASWLYKVAYRIALAARASSKAGAAALVADVPGPESPEEHVWRELRPVLDDAVMALPAKYREAFVLCCVEGKTNAEASRQLGCAKGTIDSRLARARARLRQRLSGRGVALSAAACSATLSEQALAAVPGPLAGKVLLALRGPGTAAVSARVAALTQGALRAMLLSKLQVVGTALALVAVLAGAAVVFGPILADDNSPPLHGGDPAAERRATIAALAGQDPKPAPAAGPQKPAAAQAEDAIPMDRLRELRQVQQNLRQIGLALHHHHDTYKYFPGPAIYVGAPMPGAPMPGGQGKPLLSWRVALLPYLDLAELHGRFKLDEPWDSEHNLRLLAEMPAVYAPVRPTKQKHATYLQAFVGAGAFFEPRKTLRFGDIPDGASYTLAVVEAAHPVPWTKPEDLPFVRDQALPKLGGQFQGFFNALFADGSTQLFATDADADTLAKAIQRDDGHPIDLDRLRTPRDAQGRLDPNVLALEKHRLEESLTAMKAEVVAAKKRLQGLRDQQVGAAHPDPQTAELLLTLTRLRAALQEETAVRDALRDEAGRLQSRIKPAK